MNYLLDTCVISELAKPVPEARVVEWIRSCDEDRLFLSVLTLGEIQKGISRLADGKRKNAIQRWLDGELRVRFEGRILPIDEEVALGWGLMQGEAEAKGRRVPALDGLIAATALVHQCTVATRNTADVEPTGARVFNPWERL
ncbi:MAG: type II toxin-antitoxin system VapC family toxin [Spirochaetes bacterium]|nr:type II toxin-antitoxin system VapC family toxin [Spirochaetota bacterium]